MKLASALKWGDERLPLLGAGLRYKKVLFITANVYVAQLFATPNASFSRTPEGAYESIGTIPIVAMHLSFLREVDAKTFRSSMEDVLKENGVPADDPDFAPLLNALGEGPGTKKGSATLLVGERSKDGSEKITFVDAAGRATVVNGKAGLVKKAFSLWFGKPTDSGLKNLQAELLKPRG